MGLHTLTTCALILCFIGIPGGSCPLHCICRKEDEKIYGPDYYSTNCDKLRWTKVLNGIPQQTKRLSIAGNHLTSVEKSNIGQLTQLDYIYLKDNNFTEMTDSTVDVLTNLPSLLAMELSGNPWDCSCKPPMRRFATWMESMKGPRPSPQKWIALINSYNTKCKTPTRLKGKRLEDLKQGDVCP